MFFIETMFVEFPQIFTSQPKIFGHRFGPIPKKTVFQTITRRRIMNIEGCVFRGELIQDRTKHAKIGDDSRVVFPQGLSIPKVCLSKNKHTIYIGSNHRLNIHTIL